MKKLFYSIHIKKLSKTERSSLDAEQCLQKKYEVSLIPAELIQGRVTEKLSTKTYDLIEILPFYNFQNTKDWIGYYSIGGTISTGNSFSSYNTIRDFMEAL